MNIKSQVFTFILEFLSQSTTSRMSIGYYDDTKKGLKGYAMNDAWKPEFLNIYINDQLSFTAHCHEWFHDGDIKHYENSLGRRAPNQK